MKTFFSMYWVLIASVWYFVNGILHDVFVLLKHKGKYDRELLRLLMDGHVLILSGVLAFVSYWMMLNKIPYGAVISMVIAGGMLIYCAMIFPFLKSVGTIAISMMLILASLRAMISG